MREDLVCLASHEKPLDAPATMRRHDNKITASILRGRYDALCWMLALNMDHVAGDALRFGDLLSLVENVRCSSGRHLFVLSNWTWFPCRAIRARSNADQASVTVTTVTGTLSCFANAIPWLTALLASLDPSVAMRMRWYIAFLQFA